ncbi:Tetraspannin domain-containing protein, partial [Cephalotus follicularis]
MARVSNFILGFLNSCSLLVGLVAVAMSLYFHFHGGNECQKATLKAPLLITGIILFFLSLLGLMGSCCMVSFVMGCYLLVIFLLIVAFFALTCFVFLVTNAGVVQAASRIGIKVNFLQEKNLIEENWDKITSCLIDYHVCTRLDKDHNIKEKKLSPIQSGCCMPPTSCGFKYKNSTFWIVPKSGPAVKDSDCTTWRNEQEILCYKCESCKNGFLLSVHKEWRLLSILSAALTLFTIVVYSIVCYAKRNNQS